jgi:hypothetical protein
MLPTLTREFGSVIAAYGVILKYLDEQITRLESRED